MALSGSFSFSLGSLFRMVTVLCLALGWLALLRSAQPEVAMFVMLAVVGVMAFVVALRRDAPPAGRILAAAWFFGLGVFVAIYSALWTVVVKDAVADTGGDQAEGTATIFAVGLVIVAPIIVTALTFMTRTWTWSAYDRELNK